MVDTCNLLKGHEGVHQNTKFGVIAYRACGIEFEDRGSRVGGIIEQAIFNVPGENYVEWAGKSDGIGTYMTFDPGYAGDFSLTPGVSGNPPKFSVPSDKTAPLDEQAQQLLERVAELGITPEQCMAIIMLTIATADDVRDEASKWLTNFTHNVSTIVEEVERHER